MAGLHVGYLDTDMTASVTAAKSDPADIAKIAIDGVEADLYEIVADEPAATWCRRRLLRRGCRALSATALT